MLLTKADLAPADHDWSSVTKPFADEGLETLRISSLSKIGLSEAKFRIWQIVEEERNLIKAEKVVSSLLVSDKSDEFELLTPRFDEDLGL